MAVVVALFSRLARADVAVSLPTFFRFPRPTVSTSPSKGPIYFMRRRSQSHGLQLEETKEFFWKYIVILVVVCTPAERPPSLGSPPVSPVHAIFVDEMFIAPGPSTNLWTSNIIQQLSFQCDDVPYPTHAKVPGRVSNFDYTTHQWEVVLREEA